MVWGSTRTRCRGMMGIFSFSFFSFLFFLSALDVNISRTPSFELDITFQELLVDLCEDSFHVLLELISNYFGLDIPLAYSALHMIYLKLYIINIYIYFYRGINNAFLTIESGVADLIVHDGQDLELSEVLGISFAYCVQLHFVNIILS
jgi:hypothetical protein